MTERLYYRDSFLREFEARVVRTELATEGRTRVWLDRTAFYPTSGGQPHDRGTLGDLPVEEVTEDESGDIIHLVSAKPSSAVVQGTIDWPRRFDHMQQHTGQHVLSAAFVRLFNWPTVSFHLGADICTIDLDTSSVGQRQQDGAEKVANEVVFEDRPVHIRFATAEETVEKVRRQVERQGELRLIDIEGFDCCPCGGTHVARTGQIGLILLRGMEKVKGQVRVGFVCGGRALAAARADRTHLTEVRRLLTTGPAELPAILRKQFEERRAAQREREDLLERLADFEARPLLAAAESAGERRIILKVLDKADLNYLRLLAARLVREPGVQVLLAGRGEPAPVVFAQTPGLPADMNALLRQTLAAVGGKGGGSRDFAQGSAPAAGRLEDALGAAKRRLI
jgi:alanyl-tRNA synthetase